MSWTISRHPGRRRAAGALLVLLIGVNLAGCATPIGVRQRSEREAHRALTANVLSSGELSSATRAVLTRLGLAQSLDRAPQDVLAALAGPGLAEDRARLFALAELHFRHAEEGGGSPHFLAAAAYAYAFLFPADHRLDPRPYDSRLRTAILLYNRGITAGLATSEGSLDLTPRILPLPRGGTLTLKGAPSFRDWAGRRLVHFVAVANLEVRGLRNRYRHDGIGAPLAASAESIEGSVDRPELRWVAANAKVPVTLFLRFDRPLAGLAEGRLSARMELFPEDRTHQVDIDGRAVPLEREFSSSLAYALEGSAIWDFEIAGFRSGGPVSLRERLQRVGLFMLHPHVRGRIPVVLVHGTASSPARWADLANELVNDSRIGTQYEIWFFMYNTGNPIAYSAGLLSSALSDAVSVLDPAGTDPAIQNMVVIGHSQGGLLTKLLGVESGDRFWRNFSSVPLDSLELEPETKALLQRSVFFRPLPFVRRLVFVATPHRGSFLAERFLGGLASRFISLPANLLHSTSELVSVMAQRPDAQARWTLERLPTSIENMKSSHPFLRTLNELPIDSRIRAHSIIAVRGDGPPEHGNDGVVAYESAHLEGAVSERIVRSGHSMQSHPDTINEVRRILIEHLAESDIPQRAEH